MYTLIAFLVLLSFTSGESKVKSSVAFVIDTTQSMTPEIKQVKYSTNSIFEAVRSSNASQIDEFIIAIFNDPVANVTVKTNERSEFKRVLSRIKALGGDDCPEMAMEGIKRALNASKPNSFLYAFTDASAKDYMKYEEVKSLALEKSIQINFLLTGECEDDKFEDLHTVYDRLATATSGQVFHIGKLEIGKIIEYVLANLRSTRTILLRKTYGNRCDLYKFTVDSKVWDILIALSAPTPLLNLDLIVLGPDGNKASTSDFINSNKTTIFKLEGDPGEYSINIKNCEGITVLVSAATSVSFRHGFSSAIPSSLHETSTKPLLGKKSYLAIALDNDERDVTLKTLEIRDMDDKLVQQLSLKLVDKENQFYITDLFTPPEKEYNIVINGYTKSNEKITRLSQTSTEYHSPEITTKEKPVKVTTSDKVFAQYNQPLTLTCKVEGYPEPSITWENEYHNIMASVITEKTPPYELINALQIDKATDDATYICKAKNKFSEDSDSVKVVIENKTFLKVLEYPKDVAVEYGKSVELKLKIDALPPPTIIWYQDDKEIRNNHDFDISVDGSLLKIMNVQPRLQGKYFVQATSGDKQIKYEFNVTVIDTEVPIIDKHVNSYTTLRKSSVDIKCRVIQGKPEPTITWSFDHNSYGKFRKLKKTAETIHIEHVTANDVGTYRCNVLNAVGSDHHEMQLQMEYPPTVTLNPSISLTIEKGKRVELTCKVYSSPPTKNIRWLVNEIEIQSGTKYKIWDNHLSFTGAILDSGNYSCEASNYLGTGRANVSILINDPVKIETPSQSVFNVQLKSALVLSCYVTGYPFPKVGWFHSPPYPPKPIQTNQTEFVEDNSITLQNIQPENGGFYTCLALNKIDRKQITYTVNVPVPATIISNLGTRNVELVEGDLYFNLSCNAMGSPKPTITWKINGTKPDGGGFEILDEGTLTGSYVTLSHKGTYKCEAENEGGSDSIEYEVDVHEFPHIPENPRVLEPPIPIPEGQEKPIFCRIMKEKGDLVRWFKDGQFINTGDVHKLVNVRKADAGYYTCRLCKPQGPSYTFHYKVIVGTKPKFLTDANPRVAFKAGAKAHLDCSATGDPPPTTKWWYDNSRINVDATQYTFIMNAGNIGQYMCSVSNEFDTIQRYFTVASDEECLMDLKKDFTAQQPLLLKYKEGRIRPFFNTYGGFLRMPKSEKYKFFCPGSFISYNNHNYGNNLGISCVGDSMFELGGRHVKASEITCDKAIIPLAEKEIDYSNNNKPKKCLGWDTQLFRIGFDVDHSLVYVFDVCFNIMTKTPIFVNYAMHRAIANTIPEHVANYTSGIHLQFQFEEIYDCRNQWDAISSFTGKSLKSIEDEKCCFKRRQLVNPKDVLPGISQVATYHYLNVVPQWNTCGTENWDEVERRVRDYAFGVNGKILIWTGAASVVNNVAHITLKDKLNQELQVPQFIWKVVEDIIAIIHINVPGLTLRQVSTYILCEDICETKDWMKNQQWHDIDRGYIYCCNVKKFEDIFGYENIFGKYPV